MKMLSTGALLRTVDVIEGRATLDMVEPYFQQDVQEAIAVYRQPRAIAIVDTLDKEAKHDEANGPVRADD